jgi:hypothetical protein
VKTLYMVRCNAVVGREVEFNHWYSQVHLPEILLIPGFCSAQRFQLGAVQMLAAQSFGYMTIYEIAGDNVAATLANLKAASWLQMSDAIDMASLDVSIFTAMDEPVDAAGL